MIRTCPRCNFDFHGGPFERDCPDCATVPERHQRPGNQWARAVTHLRLCIEMSRSGIRIGNIREVQVILSAGERFRLPTVAYAPDHYDMVTRAREYRQVVAAAYYCMRIGDWDSALLCLEESQPPAAELEYSRHQRRAA